jgi:hypothetical protein
MPRVLVKELDFSTLESDISGLQSETAALDDKIEDKTLKNYIINGGMDFWQRNISFSQTTNGYTVDRFRMLMNNCTIATTREADVPAGSESTYSAKMEITSANDFSLLSDAILAFGQDIEGNFCSDLQGKNVTFSCSVKTNKSGTYNLLLTTVAGHTYVKEIVLLGNETWETIEHTISVDHFGDTGISTGLRMAISLDASPDRKTAVDSAWAASANSMISTSNITDFASSIGNYIQFADVTLVEGDETKSFRRSGVDYAEELQLCQRYFTKSWRLDNPVTTNTTAGARWFRYSVSASNRPCATSFPTAMRATPLVTFYSIIGNANRVSNCGSGFGHVSNFTVGTIYGESEVGFGAVSLTSGLDEVMGLHFTADAEL